MCDWSMSHQSNETYVSHWLQVHIGRMAEREVTRFYRANLSLLLIRLRTSARR